jgi:hypothetical protein
MSEWFTLGLGAAGLLAFGNALKRGVREAKATEVPLHTEPDFVLFLQFDDDLKHHLQRLRTWRDHHPATFDTILYHCNQLLGVQMWCETKHEGYREYANRSRQHQIAIVAGVDVLRQWVAFNNQQRGTGGTSMVNFDECKTDLLAKCSDFIHNINLVVFT